MSLGSWTPETDISGKPFAIDSVLLTTFIELSQKERLTQLEQALSDDDIQKYAELMQQTQSVWDEASNKLTDTQIEHLMRFFTMAEQLPGWSAGDKSPVIWLGKVLKKRKVGINKELTLWIKNNSNNRFLPHGSLL